MEDIAPRVARNGDEDESGDGGEPITALLDRFGRGDRAALDHLIPLVYADLRRLAHLQRRRASGHETLSTTALVNEAFLKIARRSGSFEHRGHFFAVAATAMRHILVDQAKRRLRHKRGSGERPLDIGDRDVAVDSQAERLLAVDRALERLEAVSPRLRQVVECRFFAGLSEEETAAALGVTDRTVRRDWVKAKAWLAMELGLAGEG